MREYQRRFPNRRAPDRSVFVRIFQQLCLTGLFLPLREGYQHYGTLNQRRRMQRILNHFNNTPEESVWQASYQLEISYSTIWRTLHADSRHPYHYTQYKNFYPLIMKSDYNFVNGMFVQSKKIIIFH